MSNQPPQGAQQYTPEEAAAIVARVKAGLPLEGTNVPTKVTPAAVDIAATAAVPQPSDNGAAKEEPPPEPEDFKVINPPLGVYRPREAGHSIRGYLLAVQIDNLSGAAFYVVQLTEECEHIEWNDMGDDPKVGDDVAIYDAPTLSAMRNLMPQYDQAGSCIAATEVIVAPHRRNEYAWDYLVQARRVLKPGASRPAFAGVPDIPPHGEQVHADGNVMRARVDESGD